MNTHSESQPGLIPNTPAVPLAADVSQPTCVQEFISPEDVINALAGCTPLPNLDLQFDPSENLFDSDAAEPVESETKTVSSYRHSNRWINRLILGDSLSVMTTLAQYQHLKGQVQTIYFDPPYGIQFQNRFLWATNERTAESAGDPSDGNPSAGNPSAGNPSAGNPSAGDPSDSDPSDGDPSDGSQSAEEPAPDTDRPETNQPETNQPESIHAFRDTWREGLTSYLSHLRERFIAARELLTESGSIFVQIGDENVHRVRVLLDEVFGEQNYVATIVYRTSGGFPTTAISRIGNYLLWYSKHKPSLKYRPLFEFKDPLKGDLNGNYRNIELDDLSRRTMTAGERSGSIPLPPGAKVYLAGAIDSQGSKPHPCPVTFEGKTYTPPQGRQWTVKYPHGMDRLIKARRVQAIGKNLRYIRYIDDYPLMPLTTAWMDTGVAGFAANKCYIVQTSALVVKRCILMTSDPGDLVLDPTCGSGTTAVTAEQWGRRWITIDTSRVAITAARARLLGARFPYYLLADSKEGQAKLAQIDPHQTTSLTLLNQLEKGFVWERAPHITAKSTGNNTEIDVIWDEYEPELAQLRQKINQLCKTSWQDWEIPHPKSIPDSISNSTPDGISSSIPDGTHHDSLNPLVNTRVAALLSRYWKICKQRQMKMEASIAARSNYELLYDRPFEEKKRVRVSGPFTLESQTPAAADDSQAHDFETMLLENLSTAGIQQYRQQDRLTFTNLLPTNGRYIHAVGEFLQNRHVRRAGIYIGTQSAAVSTEDITLAMEEARQRDYDLLVCLAFQYQPGARNHYLNQTDEIPTSKIPVLAARINTELHANTRLADGQGNLFTVFGTPEIEVSDTDDGQIQVVVGNIEVYIPSSGKTRTESPDQLACWLVDSNYNGSVFQVRQTYFPGHQPLPYESLKRVLKDRIVAERWLAMSGTVSLPFDRPSSGTVAVKLINRFGDEILHVIPLE